MSLKKFTSNQALILSKKVQSEEEMEKELSEQVDCIKKVNENAYGMISLEEFIYQRRV